MERLPKECVSYILSFLKFQDLCRTASVNRKWKLLSEENILWKTLYSERFPPFSYSVTHWKTAFKEAHLVLRGCVVFFTLNGEEDQLRDYSGNGLELTNPRKGKWNWAKVDRVQLDDLDVPHHNTCLRFERSKKETAVVWIKQEDLMVTDTLTLFLKIKFSRLDRQQNFISLWKDEQRLVPELHSGGSMGFYTNLARLWTIPCGNLEAQTWYSLCFIYHKGTLTFFVNGVKKSSSSLSPRFSLQTTSGPVRLYLASDRDDTYWTDCDLSNIMLWNCAIHHHSIDLLRKF